MDVMCFSHLRWDFVYQRPQHLMSRCAESHRVFFIEEPRREGGRAQMEVKQRAHNVYVLVPCLPADLCEEEAERLQQGLIEEIADQYCIGDYIAWTYSPMFTDLILNLTPPRLIVYDCMDELSAFLNAPTRLQEMEKRLFNVADLIFTGGNLLYETKKQFHSNVHSFPSSIDKAHFGKARNRGIEPSDQMQISGIKVGFFGVIDERMDIALIDTIAEKCPQWNIILIGPVVKIDPTILPRRPNIFYPGGRKYEELPAYLSGWDVAIIPFAQNESTRFISPTKTPEYLAGGKPVVSTPIHDVVHPYGDEGIVYIASSPDDFIAGIQWSLEIRCNPEWLNSVDAFLKELSWDDTWERMYDRIMMTLNGKELKKQEDIRGWEGVDQVLSP